MATVQISQSQLHAILRSRNGPVVQDLVKRAIRVTNGAKRRCPVDTGRLRSSISWDLRRAGDTPVARIGTNVHYAVYVHEGTRYVRGRPFLLEALRDAA